MSVEPPPVEAPPPAEEPYRARIRELEARLEESEETLEAIRRGDFDAVVVQGPDDRQQIYTLESADRPYRVLIEEIHEGALTVGDDGTVLYCNQRLAEMLAVPQEKLIGHELARFVLEGDRATFAALLREAWRDGSRGEITLCPSHGGQVPVYVSMSRLQREDSTPILCGIIADQTEQRQHMRALADANARLEAESAERGRAEDALRQAQKMEAVGQLTGGIAHDFNNLLTIIKSSTDLLRRPDLAEDRRRRYVDAIADTVDRAAKLTNQLLAFARRQSLRPEVFDVGERLNLIADMVASIVGPRIRIDRVLPREACFVEADISQFETALVNLAVNARDAMDGEGELSLRVAREMGPRPGLGEEPILGDVVTVAVSDTGCGISREQIGRIFEPFFTTKEVGRGTGLGLSQVFGFARQSGGNVEVESELGRGSTFRLSLPWVARGGEARRETARDEAPIPGGRGRRVLVVEDNIEVGTFSTQLLQDLGYETTWTASAAEALVAIGTDGGPFDVVFTDVVMPGMNGIDLARAIQKLRPSLPIVLTSGYSQALVEDADPGFELLRKPYSVEQLSRVLRKVMRRAAMPEAPAVTSTSSA